MQLGNILLPKLGDLFCSLLGHHITGKLNYHDPKHCTEKPQPMNDESLTTKRTSRLQANINNKRQETPYAPCLRFAPVLLLY